MKRTLIILLSLVLAAIVLPPLWFSLMPEDAPRLPPPGTAVALPNGNVVNVLDSGGDGPPILLVHGLPGSAYDWRELAPELSARGFRVLALDRVGYGRSAPRVDEDFTVEANTADLLQLLEALDLRDATVVGWSYGGVMAMYASVVDASRIGRLVLVGTGGPSADDDLPPEAGIAMRIFYAEPVLRWRASVPPVTRVLMTVLSEQAYSGGAQPEWWMRDLIANFSRWDTALTYRGELLAPINVLLEPERVGLPTLIVHAADDRLAPVAIGRYLIGRIPDATYEEVSGGSHMLPVTHAPMLAERISGFVEGTFLRSE